MHVHDLHALGLPDHRAPPGHVVHIVELLGRPRCKQACGQIVMAVAHHAGNREQQQPAALDERQKAGAQIRGVASEVVVGVDAHHGIEELRGEGQRRRVRLERDDLAVGEPEALEEAHVVARFAPEVGGIDGEAVLTCHEGARDARAAAQVEHDGACGYICSIEEFLGELQRVGSHDLGADDRCGEGPGLGEFHGLVLSGGCGFRRTTTHAHRAADPRLFGWAFPTEQGPKRHPLGWSLAKNPMSSALLPA